MRVCFPCHLCVVYPQPPATTPPRLPRRGGACTGLNRATNHTYYIFFALNCTLYNPHYPPPAPQSVSEHFRVDCRLPEQALASGNSPFAPTKEVVICGEILLYAAVLGRRGRAGFRGARSIKSLARRWAPAIRISLAVKDNGGNSRGVPPECPFSPYTLLLN